MAQGFVKGSNINQWGGVQKYDDYLRGELKKQKENGVVKTDSNLYQSFHCQRDNFTKTCMAYMQLYRDQDLKRKAYVYTISFHHDDEEKNGLTPQKAHDMSMEFANKYFKDYPTLAVTHIDTDNLHTQFIVANVNVTNGRSWQESNRDMENMKKSWGEILQKNGMTESVKAMNNAEEKKEMANKNKVYPEKSYHKTMAERQINKRGRVTDKQQLRAATIQALNSGVSSFAQLKEHLKQYEINVEIRGNGYNFKYENEKGKSMTVRDKNLAKSTGDNNMLRENIEKKMLENAELDKKKFMELDQEDKEKSYAMWRMLNDRNGECLKEVDQINDFNKKIDEAEKNNIKLADTNKQIRETKDQEREKLLREKDSLVKANEQIKKQLDDIMEKYDQIQDRIKEIDKKLKEEYPNEPQVKKLDKEDRPQINKREVQRVFGQTDALKEMSATGARERVTEAGAEKSNAERKEKAEKMLNNSNKTQTEVQETEQQKRRLTPRI